MMVSQASKIKQAKYVQKVTDYKNSDVRDTYST
jgi:hypothetical protein